MVTFLNAPEKQPSFGSMLGAKLGQGIEKSVSQGINFAQQMQLEKAKGRGLAQETKQMEKIKSIELGLGTIGQMREILKRNNLGRGSGFQGLFSKDVARDRAEYEQLGRSLIPMVSAGMRVTNQKEFEEYKKVLTDPSSPDPAIEGALKGLEDILRRNAAQSGEDFSSKIMSEDKKKSVDDFQPVELNQMQEMGQSGPEELSRTRSLASALPKGAIKSVKGIADLVNLPMDYVLSKLAPEFSQKKQQMKMAQDEAIERFLPTQKKGLEDILEFTGENLPIAAFGPGAALAKGGQALAGGLAKKGAKELNLPEWAQDVASGLGMNAPGIAKGAISKTLMPSKSQKPTVDYLKSKGLTDKQIVPLLQTEKKLSYLSKIATKYPEKSPVLKDIQKGLGNAYAQIFEKGAQKNLTGKGLEMFTSDLQKTVDKLPPRFRETLKKDIDRLFAEPITYSSLAQFKDAVNDSIRGLTGKTSKGVLGILKDPTNKAMSYLDKDLFKEEIFLDGLYGKMKDFSRKMTSKQTEGWFKLSKVAPAAIALMTLKFAAAPKLATTAVAAPYAAKQILTNPRFQRMHAKMWDAFNKNNISNVIKMSNLIEKEFGPISVDHVEEETNK